MICDGFEQCYPDNSDETEGCHLFLQGNSNGFQYADKRKAEKGHQMFAITQSQLQKTDVQFHLT